jgi:hypothetical protein
MHARMSMWTIDTEREGLRWSASIAELPSIVAYGATKVQAIIRVRQLADEAMLGNRFGCGYDDPGDDDEVWS